MLDLRALHAGIDHLCLRALQLRLRLHELHTRRDARVIAVARELVSAFEEATRGREMNKEGVKGKGERKEVQIASSSHDNHGFLLSYKERREVF